MAATRLPGKPLLKIDGTTVISRVYKKVVETLDVMKEYRSKPNFFLRLASVLTKDNRHILQELFDQTSSWPIDFHELILVRDIPAKEQLELKSD